MYGIYVLHTWASSRRPGSLHATTPKSRAFEIDIRKIAQVLIVFHVNTKFGSSSYKSGQTILVYKTVRFIFIFFSSLARHREKKFVFGVSDVRFTSQNVKPTA